MSENINTGDRLNKAAEVRKFIAEYGTSPDVHQFRAYCKEKFGDEEFLPASKYYKFRSKMRRNENSTQSGSEMTRKIILELGVHAEKEDFLSYCKKHNLELSEQMFYVERKRLRKQKENQPISTYTPQGQTSVIEGFISCVRMGKELIKQTGGVEQAKALLEELK